MSNDNQHLDKQKNLVYNLEFDSENEFGYIK